MRTAVLLVAGTGSRLRPLTNDIPKCLVSLGGESVLYRVIRQLRNHGISRFVFATGYCEEALKQAVLPLHLECEFCRNDAYESTQNSISLLHCVEAVRGESFVKLDGDLVICDAVLDRLLCHRAPMSVVVDTSRKLDNEAMKVDIDDEGCIRDFGKGLPLSRARAESIGVEMLDADSANLVFARICDLMKRGKTDKYYEDVYAELIREGALQPKAVDVAGLAWSEIDTLEDLNSARALVAIESPSAVSGLVDCVSRPSD